jgi:hypothetical protein
LVTQGSSEGPQSRMALRQWFVTDHPIASLQYYQTGDRQAILVNSRAERVDLPATANQWLKVGLGWEPPDGGKLQVTLLSAHNSGWVIDDIEVGRAH